MYSPEKITDSLEVLPQYATTRELVAASERRLKASLTLIEFSKTLIQKAEDNIHKSKLAHG